MRLDPDIKKCADSYKQLRKLTKLIESMKKSHDEQRFDECVSTARNVIAHDTNSQHFRFKGHSFICSCYSKAKNGKLAVESCTEALKINPNDVDTIYNRAQAYIVEEELDNGNKQRTYS